MVSRKIILFFICMTVISGMATTIKDSIPIDTVIVKQIGLKYAETIMSADSIVANISVWENDTLPSHTLTSGMCAIVKYALCQPVMYSTDKRIYTSFYADASLIICKADSFLILELDYNINKWRLSDRDGKQICRHDLRNTELLSLIHEIWPESKNINIKYKKFIE